MSLSSTLSKRNIPSPPPNPPVPPRIPGAFAGGKVVPKWADEVEVFTAVPVDDGAPLAPQQPTIRPPQVRPPSVHAHPPITSRDASRSRESSKSRDPAKPRESRRRREAGRADSQARTKQPPSHARWAQVQTHPVDQEELPQEDAVSLQRFVIASGLSTIVHMLVLIVLGLMLADPLKRDAMVLPELEVSVAEMGHEDRSPTTKIEVQKLPSVATEVPPSGLPKSLGAPSFTPGGGGGKRVGVDIGPPAIFGAPGLDKGGDGKGDAAVAGSVDGPFQPGDGNTATFFGIESLGRKIAFVVDTSGSMSTNERYIRCRIELIESLKSLKPTQSYYVVFFSNKTYPMPQRRFVLAIPSSLKETIRWLEHRDPVGGTEPVPGIEMALKQNPDAIYLLTDGSFDDGTPAKLLALQPNTKKRIPIHTIAFENQTGQAMLKEISDATGGKYRYVP